MNRLLLAQQRDGICAHSDAQIISDPFGAGTAAVSAVQQKQAVLKHWSAQKNQLAAVPILAAHSQHVTHRHGRAVIQYDTVCAVIRMIQYENHTFAENALLMCRMYHQQTALGHAVV